jgi:hypothetical protein
MKEKLSQRLDVLRAELKTGQEMEAELEGRLSQLRATLLRISGAIQVLEELLDQDTPKPDAPTAPSGSGARENRGASSED